MELYGFDRDSAAPDWDDVWGTELYNHTHPVSFFDDENDNLADDKNMQEVVVELRKVLQAGWRGALPPID